MRVCFCVSSLFLLLVLFEEQRTPLKKKKEKENVLVSIQIFKNFQKFLPSHDSKERATEHSLLSRAALNSGTRSKRAHSRSFVRTPLKSPFFKCLKTLSQIRKNECIEKFISLPERGLCVVVEINKQSYVTKNQKKKTTMVQLIGNFDFAALCLPTVPWGKSTRKMQFFRKVYHNHLQIDRYRCCFLNRSSLCVCFCGRRFIFSLPLQLFSRHN